jgi:aryl-alcohol dehydrogenase-like predicted oxidoreductase
MNLISKIGLGSVQFGIPYGVSNKDGQTSSEEVTKILIYANKSGITYIDTASAYGNAEEVLGFNDLNNFKIISKFMPQEENNSISFQLKTSLEKLNVDALYGYLAHRPLSLLDNPKQWEELLILKQQNKIKKIGFSLNEPSELDMLLSKGMMPDLIQVPYNYFDNRFKDILIDLKAKGCEIHTRSTFLQGLFFTDVKKLPSFFDEVKKNINELQINLSDNLSGALLKHVLSLDFIDVVIMGVENEKQLKSNLTNINASHYLPPNDFNFSELVLMPSNWPKKV